MNLGKKLRLAGLFLALGAVGTLIVIDTLNSGEQARELRVRLNAVDLESFGIADHFKSALRGVNNALLHYRLAQDEAAWGQFLTNSRSLESWIGRQEPRLGTEKERAVLQEIKRAYGSYLRAAQNVHDRLQSAREPQPALGEFPELRTDSQELLDLGEALSRAHFESKNQLVAHASHILSHLRLLVLGQLGLLFLFGIALSVLVYRDMITPLRLKLIESQAVAERNEKLASLGLLASGVAHEIRTPLTAIKTGLFIQQKRLPPGSPEGADMDQIGREILRLEKIVNDFLQFARPAAPELATVPADLPLAEARRFLAPALAKSNVQLILEPSPPLQIQVDPRQLQQVLINLIKNAADSIGRDGTVTLRARRDRKILSNRECSVVVLEVEDTGAGIPPEVERRLFDPFFTTKEAGTGLGLSIAARIVENHGGTLQYQTRLQQGTTFGIVLPEAPL